MIVDTLITQTVYGLADGAVLALAALGFVLIYKATQVINFAQGAFLLIGAFTFYSGFVLFGLPLSLAALFGLVVAVALGVLVERFVLRPLVGESAISVIMVTIGLAWFLKAVMQLIFGVQIRQMPPVLPTGEVVFLGANLPLNRLLAPVVAAVVLTVFALFFQRSRHGVAMRAVADDQQAGLTMGISARRVFAMSWALAAVSALIAGVLFADFTSVNPVNIYALGLLVFPVVIIGGLESIPGTIFGGVIIGLTEHYVAGFYSSGLAEIVPYLLLVLILLIKPYGLFGQTQIERV